MENKLYNIFRIPQVSTEKVSSALIGVLDASGSMSSYWPFAARSWNQISQNHPNSYCITFSTKAAERKLPLSENINQYDCSSTNIVGGFEVLNEMLQRPSMGNNVTVVFISDGQDDNNSTLPNRITKLKITHQKKINFISIGVGSGFPTFVAMNLRDIYHNGESSLPPVFLIENTNEQSVWSSTFESLLPYTFHSAKISISPAVKVLPWLPSTKEVYENSWVISYEDKITVNSTTQVERQQFLSPTELIDIAKGWLSELQISSLKKEAKDNAKEALNILNGWKCYFIDSKNPTTKETFNQRLMKKQQNTINFNIQVIFKEIKSIAEDVILSQLSDVEAAKRLAIGTQTGKYHSAALQLKGITVSDYIQARDHFINVFQQTTFSNESDQEPSVISLQNQKDVFKEADLIEGLKGCPNQYDLVENFPLVGHSVQIKRSDGAMINPYMLKIKSIAMHHKVCDTVSLQAGNNELKMKIGDDEEEIINAVIPLFSKKDLDLKPLINTKLYHILMTFNVMGNADTCFENAYLGLLANACYFLINQTASEWRTHMLDLVANTLSMTYADRQGYKSYAKALVETPRTALITEHPEIETKCEDLTKAILVLFYLVYSKELTDIEKIQEIVYAIYAEAYGRNYPSETALETFFKIQLPEGAVLPEFLEEQKQIIDNFPPVETFFTQYEMKNEIENRISALELKVGFEISAKFMHSDCEFMKYNKVGIKGLNKVFNYFLPDRELPEYDKLMCWTVHASKYRNSHERNTTDINYNAAEILQEVKKQKEQSLIKNNKIAEKVFESLNKKFEEYMIATHHVVVPMTAEDLTNYCTEKGLDITQYSFNQVSNLLKNSCMSPACPYYMKPTKSLAQHLESNTLKCPAFHKAIKMHCKLPAEQILEKVLTGECLIKIGLLNPAFMISENVKNDSKERKEFYIEQINKLKEFYQKV
ncbi:VWA domain CoxE-like protein (macronuclear) [Tetrahymena thermophila SB210]|uniref:VWA domain CoxE-like protein n=1 Tax=Tetrahymena thermophila (strain SB210) TaxID=312017 RepID=I7LVA0_TETTS|nr:VWA domain CoxE-like protein [Tetrahymena thermophila SB210]EAR97525.1 VWA domain CoxE-like protein [Tetrahymena thermophila SB210]|eukprot:XP_001017770.1 VWA domain CoxE-like protein [Tetrahymena thermophila SB210]